jgi:cytochrome c-type biogenesis protein CcmH/NrfG
MARDDQPAPSQTIWIIIAIAALFFGSILGYVIATGHRPARPATTTTPAAAPTAGTAAPVPAFVDERQVQSYRDILAKDPTNLQAAIGLGNLLYDGGRFTEAIAAYRQALALDKRNAAVSTDLGTALWYSGQPDAALAQFEQSLEFVPNHPQTLFNIGIVKRDGKGDLRGAVEAWETLLATNPGYPDAEKVRQLITQARGSGT